MLLHLMGAAGATAAVSAAAAAALPILMRSQWERLPPPGVMQHCSLLVAKGGQQAVWQRDVAKLLQVRVDLRVLKEQRGMRMFHCTNEF
jgi:hypothetical protein